MYDSNRWVPIILIYNSSGNTMVVDLSFIVHLETVHVGRHQDVVERLDQVEEQPDIDHLDVGSLRQVLADADEHRGEDQHHRHVQRNDGFEEKFFEIVGRVAHSVQDDSRGIKQ